MQLVIRVFIARSLRMPGEGKPARVAERSCAQLVTDVVKER